MTRLMTALAVCAALLPVQTAAAADLTGNYIAEVTTSPNAESQFARVSLKVAGTTVSGTWGDRVVAGSLAGAQITLTLTDAAGGTVGVLKGAVKDAGKGITIAGDGTFAPVRGRPGSGGGGGAAAGGAGGARTATGGAGATGATLDAVTWTLTAYTPPAAPKVYDFAPTSFYTTYSAQWTPVLRIYPGDSVRTRTVDNERDSKATRYGVGGNPSTGPFYVEGALPGDTLVVHLTKVRANKKTARQGTRINARAVTAAYLVGATYDPAVTGEWTLDMERGLATLTHPTDRMKGFSVPIKTMLGCVSVAPQGQDQARGTDLGTYGGNLDYNDNVEGTTLYFPVYHAGALFGIGDAHAAMGDGEVTGAALETSADVEFTVDVIKDVSTAQVRAETKDYLISFGVSGSVAESIQASTTQLAEWLKRDYALSDSEVALYLGTVLKYDIAELVDPHINVVAKVPKTSLVSFTKR